MSAEELLQRRRREVIDRLSDAFAEDELDVAEFERRLAEAHRAEESAALDATVRGLKQRTMGPETALAVAPKTTAPAIMEAPKQVRVLLGSITRGGAWALPKRVEVNAVLGTAVLDLRQASLGPGVTELEVKATFGSIEIIVPPHFAVEVDGTAVLGSFDHLERAPASPGPQTPILRVVGRAVFGSVEVETKLSR